MHSAVASAIDLADVGTIQENRDHNLGFHMQAAGDVIVLGGDVRDHKGLVAEGYLPANALPKGDQDMVGRVAGIRPQFEFLPLAISEIKAYPVVMGNGSAEVFANGLQLPGRCCARFGKDG